MVSASLCSYPCENACVRFPSHPACPHLFCLLTHKVKGEGCRIVNSHRGSGVTEVGCHFPPSLPLPSQALKRIGYLSCWMNMECHFPPSLPLPSQALKRIGYLSCWMNMECFWKILRTSFVSNWGPSASMVSAPITQPQHLSVVTLINSSSILSAWSMMIIPISMTDQLPGVERTLAYQVFSRPKWPLVGDMCTHVETYSRGWSSFLSIVIQNC